MEEEEDVKVVVGHRFKKRESKGSEHYCEKCASVIWGVLHTWYKCTGEFITVRSVPLCDMGCAAYLVQVYR